MRKCLLYCLMMMFLFTSCKISYTLNGASIDYTKYKTISLGDFPIRAALVYPPLQQIFENKLTDRVSQQTRLQVIDAMNSNLRIEGEITDYSLSPQAVNANAFASQTRLTITVRVHYIDNVNPDEEKDQTFSAFRDFDSSQMLNDVQDQLCQELAEELTELIFNATLGNW